MTSRSIVCGLTPLLNAYARARSYRALALTGSNKTVASALSRYAAVGGPNQVVSASASPGQIRSPTQAT